MTDTFTLTGYRYSVYTRIVRVVAHVRGIPYDTVECDPFGGGGQGPHPFGRVPVLDHGAFRLYETAAITGYLDGLGAAPSLLPAEPRARARMDQVIGIVDAYVYVPLVRQVFSHRVFCPMMDEAFDPDQITAGMAAAAPVLSALDAIAQEGLVLTTQNSSRADWHLAPMMDYFTCAPEGARALTAYPHLQGWWDWAQAHPAMAATDPLPDLIRP